MAKSVTGAGLVVTGVPVGSGGVGVGELVGFSSATLVRAYGAAGGVVAAVGVALGTYASGDKGAYATVSEVSGLTGLTIGAAQYLSLSEPGGVQSTVPSGAGNSKQLVGVAVAADRIAVVLQDAGVTM